ncbi:unnamed protein product [Caenorhabditis sp. 36 PRJEB53466]|nr:unnamed protein product [Caenorhabditis sp. 36 PRJEB53466]
MSGGKHGSKLDNFRIIEQIGEGGFGVVYSAERENGEKVAIKKISRRALQSRVTAEIQAMKKMKHRNIVQYIDDFTENGETYVVMELCEHGSLRSYVKEHGPLSEPSAVYVFRQLHAAVSYMHRDKLIHRDLSAGNVFIKEIRQTDRLIVKIGDFGLATNLGRGEIAQTIVGTPGYIAPDVMRQNYSQGADVYSLGKVLYTMLTAKDPPQNGRLSTEDLSPNAADLIKEMTNPDETRRIRLSEIVMRDFMKENTDDKSRQFSRDSKDARLRSRSRDGQSQDRRLLARSCSQPAVLSGRGMGITNRPVHDRRPTTSGRAMELDRYERGRGLERPRERRDPEEKEGIWPLRMDRLSGQRVRTDGGRYIVEMDTRCRFEVAAKGNIISRILVVDFDQHHRRQKVYVHRIGRRQVREREEGDDLIELTSDPEVFTE